MLKDAAATCLASFRLLLVAGLPMLITGTSVLQAERLTPPASEPAGSRPKIGLVLAGGGALGFAHVGVLEVLEENRIPVHIVTGTSMGSIVGAAYACGRQLEEIKEFIKTTDWDTLFTETVPRPGVPYRYKAGRDREIYGDTKFSFANGKLVLPKGAVQGQKVIMRLQRLYGTVPNPARFDELPLPFRAVTADIETGEAVIPDSGDLATIVRASMSVPGFFAPVELDGKLLVDGGITNNLPVDETLKLGAERLIVVELYADLKKRAELESPFAISGQIVSLLLAQNSALQRKLMRPGDVLLEPDLTGLSSTDFPMHEEIIERGRAEAKKLVEQLRQFSVSEEEYAAYQARRTGAVYAPQPLKFVRLKNNTSVPDRVILREINAKIGDTFDRDGIEKVVQKLYNEGRYSSVGYDLIRTSDGEGLEITVNEKEWLKKYVRVGIAVEDNFEGDSRFRLGVAYRQTGLNNAGASADIKAEIGTNPSIFGELYQPFGIDTPWFVAPSLSLGNHDLRLRDGDEIIARYNRQVGEGTFRIGRELGVFGEADISVTRGYGDLSREIGAPSLPEFGYDIGQAGASVKIDSLDSPDFPTSGMAFMLSEFSSLDSLGASDEFNWITGKATVPVGWGRNSFVFSLESAVTFEERPVERSFALGGFFDVSGYQQNSIVVSDYTLGKLLYFRRVNEYVPSVFDLGVFAGGTLELLSMKSDVEAIPDDSGIVAGSVFLERVMNFFPEN